MKKQPDNDMTIGSTRMARKLGVATSVFAIAIGALAACNDGQASSSSTSSATSTTGSGGTSGTGGMTGSGGMTGTGGQVGPTDLYVYSTTNEAENGGELFVPSSINSPSQQIAILTGNQDSFTIQNKAGGTITIDAIDIERPGEIQEEEFGFLDKDIKPAEFKPVSLDKDAKFDFYLNFSPAASGKRTANIVISYSGAASGTHSFKYTGLGTAGADFVTDPAGVKQYLYGTSNSTVDEQFGALAADADGNVYMTGNEESASDNLILYQVKKDGTLGWHKVFDAKYNFKAPDSLQNGQTGGTSGSLVMGPDKKLYLMAAGSWTVSNNSFYVYVAQVSPTDGSIGWEKIWSRVPVIGVASESSMAYALDVSDKNVYITGDTGSGQILALALKSTDGSVLFQREIELVKSLNDRGFAVRYDAASKALYIGGDADGQAALIKLKAADTASPSIEWTKFLGLGKASQVSGLDIDATGNLYAALGFGGGSSFVVGSYDSTGKSRWVKHYAGSPTDKNNAHVVKITDGSLYAGGRLATPNFDGQQGDGCVLKLDPANGTEQAAMFYYSGKKAEQLTEHRVKGLAVVNDKLLLGLQAYTATMNGVRFWGYWYQDGGALADVTATVSDISGPVLTDLTKGVVAAPNNAGKNNNLELNYADASASFVFQKAQDKHDGFPPDGELMFIEMPKL